MSDMASEITWLSSLLKEIGISLPSTPELYCDNLSSVRLSANPTFHGRMKHFELDHHYVRERVALGSLVVYHVPAQQQIEDIFTKSLPREAFCSLRYRLGVDFPPTPSLKRAIKRDTSVKTESSPNDNVLSQNKQAGRDEYSRPNSLTKPTSSQRSSSPNDKNRGAEGKNSCTNEDVVHIQNRFDALFMLQE